MRSKSHRLSTLFTLSYSLAASYWSRRILGKMKSFSPDAIVSVTHGFLWDTAVFMADQLGVPCHLIHHDHWRATVPVPKSMSNWAGQRWAKACRSAKNNFCVSHGMLDEVQATGAKHSSLLFPTTSTGMFLSSPSNKRDVINKQLVFGYAGTLQTPGHGILLKRFARIVTERGHTLRLFTPYNEEFLREVLGDSYRPGMSAGFLQGASVPAALREQTDALFLPLSFAQSDTDNMRVSFPCKICDYCASGRPVIAWMPPYSAAARWAGDHSNIVMLHTSQDTEPVTASIRRLENLDERLRLGTETFTLGRAYFSAESASQNFLSAIRS